MNHQCRARTPGDATAPRGRIGSGLRRRARAIVALLAPALCAGTVPAADPPFEALRAVDTQMGRIGYRLSIANASLCDRHEPGLGLLLHTADQYPREIRAAAVRHFGMDGPLGVAEVLAGTPAAIAGVWRDDALTGAGPVRFAAGGAAAPASTDALIRATDQLARLPPDRPLTLHLRRSRTAFTRVVRPVPACRTRYEVVIGDTFVAVADGTLVQLGSRFFADYQASVAAPIAHELAHNILHHRERLDARGVDHGMLSGIGRNVRYLRQAELEADILSVSLLANAGYDPALAVTFWEAFGPAHAGGALRSRSHPAWRDRITVIKRAITALGPQRPHRPAVHATRAQPLDGDWQRLLARHE